MNVIEMIQKYYPAMWGMEEVHEMLLNAKITLADFLTLFPVTEENPMTDELLVLYQKAKKNELRTICNNLIESGVDVQTSHSGEETEHFSLDNYDQANITNMFYSVLAGVDEYPYHADGKECTTYTKKDIVAIYVAAQTAITYHTTYNNMLHALVERTNDVDDLAAITYGMELPDDLAETMQTILETAQEQIEKILHTLIPDDLTGTILD